MPQMPETDSTDSHQSHGFFAATMRRVASLITFKRLSISVAGTFAFVGAAAALNASGAVGSNTGVKTTDDLHTAAQQSESSVDQPAATPATPSEDSGNSSTNSTSFSATTTNGKTDVNLNVNGKDIPVSNNSSTHQVITNSDGSQTTVNMSSNVSSNGTASNTSISSFSLNVNSSSSEVNNTP
jgi:hypothetical protein